MDPRRVIVPGSRAFVRSYRSRIVVAASVQTVPQTREDVVAQAGQALNASLNKKSSSRKSFKKTATSKLAVEISLADQSPESVSELISGLLRALDADIQGSCTLAFHDVDAALVASDLFSNEVLSVQGFEAHNQAGILLIVGVPSGQEEEAVALTKWRGPAVVLLSLDTNSITSKMSRLRNSFQTVFAFEPFATKGLLRTTEGLILKRPGDDKAGSPWLVYKRVRGDYRLIGRTSARPTASDIELAFYNSSASESPVTQGITAVRSLLSKQGKRDGQD